MFPKKITCLITAFVGCVLICGCNSSNHHAWILPNKEKIEYYEGPIETPGFQANPPEYIRWSSEQRGTNTSNIGRSGGYKLLTLHLNQNQTLGWITGQYAGSEREFYVAIIDLKKNQITDGGCMWTSNLDSVEIKYKSEVEQSSATATVIEEQK